jgi:antitoxin component of MazEF toxin-antitoxin module
MRLAGLSAQLLGDWRTAESAAHDPSLTLMKLRDVYTTRYYRQGNSFGIILPPDIREAMNLTPGDTLALNFQHGVMWAVKVTPGMIATREKVARIFDELFPDKEKSLASQ